VSASTTTASQQRHRQRHEADTPHATGGEGWRHRHLLDLDVVSRDEIALALETADVMREVLSRQVPKAPTLRGRTIVTLFYEASTRTRASFEWAAKALSADVINITAQASSVTKGESLVDTTRTLAAMGTSAVVMRHPQSGAADVAAQHASMPIINGGDGWHAHPTQALLDLYTLRQQWDGAMEGRRVAIVGDIAHSRVARSNIWSLTAMGVSVVLCGPPTLLPTELGEAYRRAGREIQVTERVEEALEGADAVMALRLQRERQAQGLLSSIRAYAQRYQINAERLALARPDAVLLHPGPVNEGVEVSPDVADGHQSVIQEQVRNGVAVRMAILYLILAHGEGIA
jgi:aspartate carbamoyltransferase catalytic subunit